MENVFSRGTRSLRSPRCWSEGLLWSVTQDSSKSPKGVPLWPIPSAFLLAQAPWEISPCPHLGSATPGE